MDREQIVQRVFVLGAIEPAQDDAPFPALPFEGGGLQLPVQPLRHRVEIALRRPLALFGRHLASDELVMGLDPGRHRPVIAEIGPKFIEPQPGFLHLGAMAIDAMRVEKRSDFRLEYRGGVLGRKTSMGEKSDNDDEKRY